MPTFVAINQGAVVKLADDTFWRLSPRDFPEAKRWVNGAETIVEKNSNFIWKYKLTNVDDGTQAFATPIQVKF